MRLTHPSGDEPIDLSTVDLFDPAVHAKGDPHAVWLAMRTHEPVHWQQVRPGLGFWSVTTHADVATVLRDHTAFTSEHGTLLNLLGRKDPAGGRQLPATDPPRHTRMRSPIRRALAGGVVAEHRATIREEVHGLLTRVVDGEPFDFAALTDQLPMAVMGTLMGLPRDTWAHLTRLTAQAVAPDDPDLVGPGGAQATLDRAHRELFASLHEALTRREDTGTTDLVDALRAVGVEDGEPLGAAEIVANCYSLLLGANVTTPQVPNAALVELTASGTYADWADHPDLLDGGIEEALRWSSPASHFIRYATRDVRLGETTIGKGEAVAAWLGSANRDATVFPDPFTFDIRRDAGRHLALGVGPHYCLGHALVRTTLEEFFAELFLQFSHFEAAGEPAHLHSNFINGIKHLPVVGTRRIPGNTSASGCR
ncbi:cytochrome P450 [Actinophytocola oryzae]|uniref:Cytochrome P450 n=1 Tax=Actinophytocola oryzae TaxID=502181 RepID=A0A4R7W1M7_9PSEU|nr:cytochrome P450 [Actinophytocola oryzae]TDV56470.1 cytochrome P450 [Actinophytocola oryzae]